MEPSRLLKALRKEPWLPPNSFTASSSRPSLLSPRERTACNQSQKDEPRAGGFSDTAHLCVWIFLQQQQLPREAQKANCHSPEEVREGVWATRLLIWRAAGSRHVCLGFER